MSNKKPILTKENVDRQIKEMWDGIMDIPHNDPDRDSAIEQGHSIERNMRESLRKQEIIRDLAPSLLEGLEMAYHQLLQLKAERGTLSMNLIEGLIRDARDGDADHILNPKISQSKNQ